MPERPKTVPRAMPDSRPIQAPSAGKKAIRVLVAGQVPPPVCGQNLNIRRMLEMLGEMDGIETAHWAFRFTPAWSTVRRAGWKKAIELFRVWIRLVRLRMQGRIDAVLYPVGGPHAVPLIRDLLLLPWACLLARRVVLHFRAAGLAEAMPGLNRLLRAAVSLVYRRCGHAIVLTEFGKRDPAAAGLTDDRIAAIPNACEDRYRREWRKQRQPGDEIALFHAGLLCPDKGTPALLEAFGAVAARNPQVRLKLAGEPMGGLTRESMEETVSRLGIRDRVDFCGVLRGEALDRAYAEADVFVFATVAPFESFGMVLIESMMWGLPIVASDWRANREVLGYDGGANVIYEVSAGDQAEALENALDQAVRDEDQWTAWGRRNRRRFLDNFEIGRMRRDFADYFGSLGGGD